MAPAASWQAVIYYQKLPIRKLAQAFKVHTASVHIIASNQVLLVKQGCHIHLFLTKSKKQREKI